MAKASRAADVSSFTTDAKFRTWVQAVHDAVAASGMIQTTDTGQINPVTVARPTAAVTLAGYEIWRFNDALQNTAPIYVKLSYYTGNNASGNNPSTRVQVGRGSDGAGNLTGLNTGTAISAPSSTSSSAATGTAMTILSCHTDGFFSLYMSSVFTTPALTGSPGIWMIDRFRNSSGVATAEGYNLLFISSNAATFVYSVNYYTSSIAGAYTGAPLILDQASLSGKLTQVYSVDAPPKQLLGAVGLMRSDGAQFSTFTCDPFNQSQSRIYIVVGSNDLAYWHNMGTAATNVTNELNVSMAFLWED